MFNEKQAKEILEILIKGNDYAEIFVEKTISKSWSDFDNKRFTPNTNISRGTGIRTWNGKDIVYISIDSIDFETIKAKVLELENKSEEKNEIEFTTISDNFKQNNLENQDTTSIKNKLENIIHLLKSNNEFIKIANCDLKTTARNTLVANSKGAFIKKTDIYSNLSYSVIAQRDEESSEAFHNIHKQVTLDEIFKIFESDKEQKEFKWLPQLATKLLDAPRIDSGEMNVILPSGFGAVLFHEAVGHPLEATQVAKGSSLLANKINQRIATDLVTLIDDGTIEGEIGTSKYDDEGNKTTSKILIEKGILKSYLIDEHNGNVLMNQKANGSGRRQNYRYSPTSRMSNTFIKNGKSTVDEIIKATKYGFYAKKLAGGQVDPFTGKFNFGVSEGYLIEDGKIKHLVKNATLIGNGIEALKYIDMTANDFKISPGICGSASGYIPVTVGQPTLRVTKMIVGGK